MSIKFRYIVMIIAVFIVGCADRTSPEYAVKTFIDAVKNNDEKLISEMIDYDRILVSLKKESYVYMLPEEKKLEIDKLEKLMLMSLKSGDLSVIRDISPVVDNVSVVPEGSGDKARVIISDKKGGGAKFEFRLANTDGIWKIVFIGRVPA